MLDERSLEIISRFKQSLNGSRDTSNSKFLNNLQFSNRGAKSITGPSTTLINDNALVAKVVEYEGSKRLVLTNDSIDKSVHRRRRKWRETYGDPRQVISEEQEQVKKEDENEENEEEKEDYNESFSDDDDVEGEDEDENPFKKIKIAEILQPLSHPSEVISHPAILKTYKLQTFNNLGNELIELIEVEQENLNWLNKLLQVLNGEDWHYLLEENLGLEKYDHGLNQVSDDDTPNTSTIQTSSNDAVEGIESASDLTSSKVSSEVKEEQSSTAEVHGAGSETEDIPKRITRTSATQDEEKVTDPFFALPKALKTYEEFQSQQIQNHETQEDIVREELVNYLQVSIQRQQEYIKNLSQIRNGIVRSDRLRQDILKWGKEMYEKKSS